MSGKEEQTFGFETMAVVLYCVLESGVTLGDKHYQLMSALDGSRSANAFNHQFRKVKARAKELKQQHADKARGTGTGGKKRRIGKKEAGAEENGDDDEEEEEMKETPRKKAKTKVKEEKSEEEDDDGLDHL
ncbi:hypothetical protein AC579_6052 [Pseudocercospora musae]|uniref:Uncharacterized protein n=1 Tax=Pseudocercospora musae TaxID=113226 RepID=A0A139HU50_9PEZI|nr:hypothetical protein AC579_6052 [Pseudocercospora musae]